MESQKKKLTVTAAIIIHNEHILCLQRNNNKYSYIAYKYEFPGGKVEIGESNEEALMRELKEELEIDVALTNDNYFMTVNHEYPDFCIEMHAFIYAVPTRAFTMTEHIDYKWLSVEHIDSLEWAAADLPIVKKLMEGKDA